MIGLDNPTHLLFVVIILLLLFGAKRLPELGRSLGSSLREFRSGVGSQSESLANDSAVIAAPPAAATSERTK